LISLHCRTETKASSAGGQLARDKSFRWSFYQRGAACFWVCGTVFYVGYVKL
jgi:hypothetical protein